MDTIEADISVFVEKHLPQLGDLISAWLKNKPELSSFGGSTKLLEDLHFLKLDSDQLNSLVFLASREEVQPRHIVDKIIEMKISHVARELNTLLRNLNMLSKTVERSRHENQLSLETRALFETRIFQKLNFLYENQLCDQKMLRMFFSIENTLEITYEHLQNLFKIRKRPGEDLYFTLMPELSFVLNDWNTAHLHSLLRGEVNVILMPNVLNLDMAQQACLVELMLIGTIQRFKRSHHFRQASPEIKTIMAAVTNDRILKHWWLNDSPNSMEQEAVKKWIFDLVTFFGKTGDSKKRFEYLISYYLYNFIKTYQTSHFPTLPFNDLRQNFNLDSKFKVFQAGIILHEAVNRSFDYGQLVQLPPRQRELLPIVITSDMVEGAKTEMYNRADDYIFIKENLERISTEDQALSQWLENNFFLRFYNTLPLSKERRNLWSYGQRPLKKIVSG
ncbi:hypothetical protein O181_037448 [Austropuccinia psidii MF-1]|uniref:Uncharacterized protein n=1 Tax=Austropuccinia psidii MF-1 TaxID=1389203 RepID=A0A9Q3D9F4_9BASI|nr:hypothetical protein [Austropuccinia psidii MF-1]